MTRIHLCNKMVVYIKWEMNEEKMDYKNYIEIRKISLLYYQYCFVDTGEYLADGIFYQNRITVRYGAEFVREGTRYRFIFCKIRKKDRSIFFKSMEELKKKMLLTGHGDYEYFCERIITTMKRWKDSGNFPNKVV